MVCSICGSETGEPFRHVNMVECIAALKEEIRMNPIKRAVTRQAQSKRKTPRVFPLMVELPATCQLTDTKKATKFRIPACRRPARWAVYPDMLTGILFVCDYHRKKFQKDER